MISKLADDVPGILHIATIIGRSSFGLGPVVLNLALQQQVLGLQTDIWCLDTYEEIAWATKLSGLAPNAVTRFSAWGPQFLGFSPMMEQAVVGKAGMTHSVLHQHGIWTALSRVANRWRAALHRPTVITPHGSLEPWTLRKSVWKKRLALFAYENQNLRRAACLHALAESEATSFRKFGLTNPIAVIPNGISDGWLKSAGDAEAFQKKFKIPEGTRILLFLGRITPKKGLPMLLEAMRTLREHLGSWRLIIAGADEFGHQTEIEAMVERLDLESWVQFVGPVFDQDKRNAFAAADLFALPSYSEGAPIVILEALAAGVPVLATKGSPWEELVTYGCGWWTEISANGICDALCDALQQPREHLAVMGQKGRDLVAARYTWSRCAEMSVLLYRWLIGRDAKPSFVTTL